MGRRIIGLLDQDTVYMDRVADYLRASDFNRKFTLKQFTNRADLEAYLCGSNRVDILAVDQQMLLSIPAGDRGKLAASAALCLQFGEEKNAESEGIPFLLKYQPLNQLLSQVESLSAEKGLRECKVFSTEKKGRIVAVYSAVGGCGKTTISGNLASQLSLHGYKVFYLNLEWLCSASFFPPGPDPESFGRLLYYLNFDQEFAYRKLPALKTIDPVTKVEYLNPLTQLEEIEEMSFDQASFLVKALAESGDYDFIIADLDASLHERIAGVISQSDILLWILQDDVNVLKKTAALWSEWVRRSGAQNLHFPDPSFWINKYTGSLANDLSAHGIEPISTLPYIPHWKMVSSADHLIKEPVFQQHIMHSFRLTAGLQEAAVND